MCNRDGSPRFFTYQDHWSLFLQVVFSHFFEKVEVCVFKRDIRLLDLCLDYFKGRFSETNIFQYLDCKADYLSHPPSSNVKQINKQTKAWRHPDFSPFPKVSLTILNMNTYFPVLSKQRYAMQERKVSEIKRKGQKCWTNQSLHVSLKCLTC